MESSGIEESVEGSKPEAPTGVTGIAIVIVFSGIGYVAQGVAWVFGIFDPASFLISILLSALFIGGGIIMIFVGKGLVDLKWWALWGSITMLAVTILVISINPFAAFQVWDDPLARASGAVTFFIIVCYLAMPTVRNKFLRPNFTPI